MINIRETIDKNRKQVEVETSISFYAAGSGLEFQLVMGPDAFLSISIRVSPQDEPTTQRRF